MGRQVSARHTARAATMDSVDGDQGAGPGDDAMASNSRMKDDENFIRRMMSGDKAVCQLQERVAFLLTQNDLLERENRGLVNEVGDLRRQIQDWKIANVPDPDWSPPPMPTSTGLSSRCNICGVPQPPRATAALTAGERQELEQEIKDLRNIQQELIKENTELYDTNEKWADLIDVMKIERRDLLFEQFPPEFSHARNMALGQRLLERGIGEFFVWPPPATPPPDRGPNLPPPPQGPPPGVDPLASMST